MISKSGIYIIKNRVNQRCYVGSSCNIKKRCGVHLNFLKQGKHPNGRLQNFVNKYGADAIYFEVLEYCSKDDLIEREQYHIDTTSPFFNISLSASAVMTGRKHSEETKLKMAKAKENRVITDEWKANLSKAQKNRPPASKEWREKVSQALKGRVFTEEWKRKMSEVRKGKKHSEESKRKMSEQRKGKYRNREVQIWL